MTTNTAAETVAEIGADLLYGMPAIATFLHVSARQGYHLAQRAGLPTFKLGGVVCARKVSLNTWLADQEAKARKPEGVPA